MKIAIDIRTAGGEKTGKGWYTFHMVRGLLENDKINQYLLYSREKIPGFEEFHNVTYKPIYASSLNWHYKVAKDAIAEKVDIFFAPTSFLTPNFLPESIKTVLTVHDLVALLFPLSHNKKAVLLEKALMGRALKKATHVCTVSDHTKKDLIERFNYDRDKVTTIYCGADENFKELPSESLKGFIKETNLPKRFFLAVGTIEPRKNFKKMLLAFAEIKKEFRDVHLIIVGKNGWKSKEVYQAITENRLAHKVHVLGYISGSNLVKLYNLAIALVFPSLYEGFGIPPLEAMKSGCPVIASDRASIPEVVGDAAITINPEDEKEIAAAMKKLITNEDLRYQMLKKGHAQAEKFSWDKSAKQLLEIFKAL